MTNIMEDGVFCRCDLVNGEPPQMVIYNRGKNFLFYECPNCKNRIAVAIKKRKANNHINWLRDGPFLVVKDYSRICAGGNASCDGGKDCYERCTKDAGEDRERHCDLCFCYHCTRINPESVCNKRRIKKEMKASDKSNRDPDWEKEK